MVTLQRQLPDLLVIVESDGVDDAFEQLERAEEAALAHLRGSPFRAGNQTIDPDEEFDRDD